MGTVIRYSDGSCAYYGFELRVLAESEFGYIKLPITNSKCVYASKLSVCIKDEDGNYWFWGYFPYNLVIRYYDDVTEPRFIFSNPPLFWEVFNN